MSAQPPSQHIPADIVSEFRSSLKSEQASRQFHLKYPSFCEKTMDYFEKMGHFAERAATKSDLEQHMSTVTDVLMRQTDKIKDQDRRINDIDQRLRHAEFLAQHTKISIDTNTEMSKQQLALSQTISERLDEAIKKMAANPPIFELSKIPALAWPVFGVVSIALIAAATGQMAAFISWLGTIKIFGGV